MHSRFAIRKSILLYPLLLLSLIHCASQPTFFEGKEPRSYAELENRISKLKGVTVERIGTLPGENREYNAYLLISPPETKVREKNRQNILLSGGAHGDEPAGVYALLEFLEKEVHPYTKQFRFYVFPCLNPSGFESNRAKNSQSENVNRQFYDKTQNREAQLVINVLKAKGLRFSFTIDLHEIPPYWEDEGWKKSDNPKSAYLYETQADPTKRMGQVLMNRLPPEIEVCTWKSIYGDKAINGVVSYPEGNGNAVYAEGTTFDAYLHRLYTEHSFTNETPIVWPLEKRVRTHLSWLKTALDLRSGVFQNH